MLSFGGYNHFLNDYRQVNAKLYAEAIDIHNFEAKYIQFVKTVLIEKFKLY